MSKRGASPPIMGVIYLHQQELWFFQPFSPLTFHDVSSLGSIPVLTLQETYNGFKKKWDLTPPAFLTLMCLVENDKKKSSLHQLHSSCIAATGLPRPCSKSGRCGEGKGTRLDVAGADRQVKLQYGRASPVALCGTELACMALSGNAAVAGVGLDAQGG